MKYTENYGFDKPEGTDFVDVEHFNANTEQLDKLLCPEYTEEKTIAELQSGEKLSTAFGKLAKAVKDLISHLADKVVHITSNERTLWNTVSNKADSNHTHNYAGSDSAGGAATTALACTGNANTASKMKKTQLSKTDDLDTLKDTDFTVYYAAYGNSIVNNPEAPYGFGLKVYCVSGSVIAQELVSQKGPMYIRYYNGTKWDNWKKIACTNDNVESATKLQTSRTLTIGDTGKSFNGSSDVSWTLSEIGAAPATHTHNYAGSSSAGGSANSAKTLYYTRYIDGIPFDGSSNLSRLGTCTTATYTSDKEVAISAFDDEGAQDAILYIQFTATYEGALNDAHAISINGGEPLTIYYKGEVFKWETYFSNYPFCDGQIHQFRYFWTPMGSYLELIAPQNRAVANNLTTTNEKIALAAPMGKQLAETDASLQEQISTLNSNISPMSFKKVKNFALNANGGTCTISNLLGQYILTSNQGAAIGDAAGMSFITITTNSAGCIAFILCGGERYKQINVSVTAGSLILTNPNNCDIYMNLYKI